MRLANLLVLLTMPVVLAACGPAEVGVWAVNAALRPSGPGPDICEYNPVRAYIEQRHCKNSQGQLLPSPITPANVNTAYEGACVLDMAIQRDRMDVFEEAWTVGANPNKCAFNNFYEFLVAECRTDPAHVQRYIDASMKAGWFMRAAQAQQLLQPAINLGCHSAVEWALAKGAKATMPMQDPALKGQTLLVYAYKHYATSYAFRNHDAQKTFRLLVKSGGCDASIAWPPAQPEAQAVMHGILGEVCGS